MIPDVNKDAAGILKNIECFALDMDGTIYLGEQWIEGAREFLSAVEAAGKRYVFLTNNSSKNPQVYVRNLCRKESCWIQNPRRLLWLALTRRLPMRRCAGSVTL